MKSLVIPGIILSLLMAGGSFMSAIQAHLSEQQGTFLMLGIAAVVALASIAAALVNLADR